MDFSWSAIRLLTKPLKRLWRWVFGSRFSKQLAPLNILELATPGTSLMRIVDLLGALPDIDDPELKIFKFSNAVLQLEVAESIVRTATLLVKRPSRRLSFDLPYHEKKIGTLRVGDICRDRDEMRFDFSSKFCAIWIEKYYGNPKNYLYYSYGVFNGPGAVKGDPIPYDGRHVTGDIFSLRINLCSVSSVEGRGCGFDFWR